MSTNMVYFWYVMWYSSDMSDIRKAKTIRLDEQDQEAIRAIKAEYGAYTDNDAIRMALRMTLRDIRQRQAAHPEVGGTSQGKESR